MASTGSASSNHPASRCYDWHSCHLHSPRQHTCLNTDCTGFAVADSEFKSQFYPWLYISGTQLRLPEPQFPSLEDVTPSLQGCGNKASPDANSTYLQPQQALRADQPLILIPTLRSGQLTLLSDHPSSAYQLGTQSNHCARPNRDSRTAGM